MDPVAAPTFLKTPIERLVRALAPTRIVLFGSYAKGTEHPRSDVDLLVIAGAAGQPATALRRARQLVATNFPPIDIVLCTPEDVEHADRAASPFLQSILESGVTVFSRPEPLASFDARTRFLDVGVRADAHVLEPAVDGT